MTEKQTKWPMTYSTCTTPVLVKCWGCGNTDSMDDYKLIRESISFYSLTYKAKIKINLEPIYLCSQSILGSCRSAYAQHKVIRRLTHIQEDKKYATFLKIRMVDNKEYN